MGYAIVVDVSVARAAGTSEKPLSTACRHALAAVRDSDHRIAMSDMALSEWQKVTRSSAGYFRSYASNIALEWLTQMRSSGRVDEVVLELNSELRQRTLQGLQNDGKTASSAGPVAKYFHLVETALLSDRRVLSLDQKMFAHLGNLLNIANEVCEVMWVNPEQDPAEVWLIAGAPDTPAYHVCLSADEPGMGIMP